MGSRADRPRRVKFAGLQLERLATNGCAASVAMEWNGRTYVGAGEAAGPEFPELRCAGQAATYALQRIVDREVARFTLLDTKPVKALDATAVVVALALQHRGDTKYTVGFCMVNVDPADAAVRAVLNGTNRFLTRVLPEG